MTSFHKMNIPAPLLRALDKMKFQTPTPIQEKAVPVALEGRDVLGSAQTGTGKTGAFGIPMVAHLIKNPRSMALVMTPTRELAAQVQEAVDKMAPPEARLGTALLIGGMSMGKQLAQLRARPRIIIGTPGRINDHLSQGSLKLGDVDFLVLDETDRMLDMGFETQIERIVGKIRKQRQTLLFSATLPPHIVKLSAKYMHNPERVAVGDTHLPVEKIKQEIIRLPVAEKLTRLFEQLEARKGSIIIFVRTKRGADKMAKKLTASKITAEAIHGNLSQNRRNAVIAAFRAKKFRVMVATDIAARGLDIPHIEHVINYDLPQVAEDYIHRIGRTARAGAEGSAVCFITPEDSDLWRDIHKLLNPGAKPLPREEGARKPSQKGGGGNANNMPDSGKKSFFARRRLRKSGKGGGQGDSKGRDGQNRAGQNREGQRRDGQGGGKRRDGHNSGQRRENHNGGQRRDNRRPR